MAFPMWSRLKHVNLLLSRHIFFRSQVCLKNCSYFAEHTRNSDERLISQQNQIWLRNFHSSASRRDDLQVSEDDKSDFVTVFRFPYITWAVMFNRLKIYQTFFIAAYLVSKGPAIDPLGQRPVGIIVFAHVVLIHFSKSSQTKYKTMFATGKTVGLAEWIIDDTCLVLHFDCGLMLKHCFRFPLTCIIITFLGRSLAPPWLQLSSCQ